MSGAVALALTVAVMATSVFFSLPSNVVSVRDGSDTRVFFSRALPQGWAFFTKPPSDPELVAYTVTAGEPEYATLTPNSRPANLFGLSRRQRAQGPEIAAMANQVADWTDCDPSGDCLAGLADEQPVVRVENTAPRPTLCGLVALVETEPVPWSYRDDYDGWRIDSRRVLVEAVCDG